MRKEILEYLSDSHDFKPLNDFLKSIIGNTSLNGLRALLLEMGIERDGVIICDYADNLTIKENSGLYHDLSNTPLKGKITNRGREELKEYQLTEHSKQVDQSIIDTNASVRATNLLQERLGKAQRNFGIITLIVATLSLIAIGFSAYYSSQSVTGNQLLKLNTTLQENNRLLDSIQKYQKGVDSSLRKLSKHK